MDLTAPSILISASYKYIISKWKWDFYARFLMRSCSNDLKTGEPRPLAFLILLYRLIFFPP